MIFPESFLVAFVALVGVNAGPCRPSSSGSSMETTTSMSSAVESTVTASTFFTQASETVIATVSESEIPTTTIMSSTIKTSTAVESDTTTLSDPDTTTLVTTNAPSLLASVTATIEATSSSEAPEAPTAQCADLANPYTDEGFLYELRCDWGWDSYQDLDYITDSTMEKCIKACSRNDDCDNAQFQTSNKLCILIGTGFDYSSNKPGTSNAVKNRPT
jgi:hypothetical protein